MARVQIRLFGKFCVHHSQQTVALYEQIRADRLDDRGALLPACASPRAPCAPMLRALSRLSELHTALIELEPQLQEDVLRFMLCQAEDR